MFPAVTYRDLVLQMAPTATYRDKLNYEPKVVKFNATANFLLVRFCIIFWIPKCLHYCRKSLIIVSLWWFQEQVAVFLAGRPDSRKVPYAQTTPNHNNHLTVPAPINGIE